MEEFSALAARVAASVGDLRGVLILSRDGLVLGAFPEGDEALVKPAWLRFAGLGEPDKGFVEFADELWAYVRRGPYASFAVTGPKVRPGLLMDQLEQMLLAAEEIRAKREALRLPDVAPAPSGKPRTSLHPEPRAAPQPAAAPQAVSASPPTSAATSPPPRAGGPPQAPTPPARPGASIGAGPGGVPAPRPTAPQPPARPAAQPPPARAPAVSGPPSAPSPAPGPDGGRERPAAEAEAPARAPAPALDEGTEVDPVLLAQEFSRLLQETGEGDET